MCSALQSFGFEPARVWSNKLRVKSTTVLFTPGVIKNEDYLNLPYNRIEAALLNASQRWIRILDESAAKATLLGDAPYLFLFKRYDRLHPGSKFILTTRAVAELVESDIRMSQKQGKVKLATLCAGVLKSARNSKCDWNIAAAWARPRLAARYIDHVRAVRHYFAGRPGDLLEVDVTKTTGADIMTQIAEFTNRRPRSNMENFPRIRPCEQGC